MGTTVKLGRAKYPLVGLTINALKLLGAALFMLSITTWIYLHVRADLLASGDVSTALQNYQPGEIRIAAAIIGIGGVVIALLLGAVAQFMAMQRDRTLSVANQVELLEDILELNEEASSARSGTRVDMCDGCGKLGALHRIDSGEWTCRECRRQLRTV